jgi:hypothetical protein
MLKKEAEKALCLSCADLDHLVYLPQGNTAMTRRASKYTTLRAILVRFSRSRQRYEARVFSSKKRHSNALKPTA